MTPRLSRLLIALLLSLLVPVQGFAAVSAGVCMALGDAGAGAVHSHDDGSAGTNHSPHEDDPAAGDHHCAPCVACCATAAISSSAALVIAGDCTHALASASPPFLAGVQPDTLDRPPLGL